jgi:hypothetical protein
LCDAFTDSYCRNEIDVMTILLENNIIDPSIDNNLAVKITVKLNYYDIAQLLLQDERVIQKLSPKQYQKFSKLINNYLSNL